MEAIKIKPETVKGAIHSKYDVEEITLIESLGGNKFIAIDKDGKKYAVTYSVHTDLLCGHTVIRKE